MYVVSNTIHPAVTLATDRGIRSSDGAIVSCTVHDNKGQNVVDIDPCDSWAVDLLLKDGDLSAIRYTMALLLFDCQRGFPDDRSFRNYLVGWDSS